MDDSAAALLTSISPAPADDASLAVVFTASPTAVKSQASPSPTRPTYATPVWTPMPIGTHGSGPSLPVSRRSERAASDRRDACSSPAKPGNEERDRLVADELVDDPVPGVDDSCSRPVEAGDQPRELLRLHVLCERRRSANVREQQREPDLRASRLLVDRRKHARQSRRFSLDGPNPNGFRITLPGAFSGAAQSLQRGPAGTFPRTARKYFSELMSPMRSGAPLLRVLVGVIVLVSPA